MNTKIFNNAHFTPKGDYEANWNKAVGFIPLDKEIIIYKPDAKHSVARLKVGDGVTTVQDLPFITDIEGVASEEWVKAYSAELSELLKQYTDTSADDMKQYVDDAITSSEKDLKQYTDEKTKDCPRTEMISKEIVNGNYNLSYQLSDNLFVSDYIEYLNGDAITEFPKLINVVLDGAYYTNLSPIMIDTDAACVGNLSLIDPSYENTGESFAIILAKTVATLAMITTESSTHSLIISVLEETSVKLDEKYLPDNLAKVSDVENIKLENAIQQAAIDDNDLTIIKLKIHPIGITFNLRNLSDVRIIDWGDGVIDTWELGSTCDNISHYYNPSSEYKNYTCKIVGCHKIGFEAFKHNSHNTYLWLNEINMSEKISTIGDYAFADGAYDSLQKIIIPSSVNNIGYRPFLGANITIVFKNPVPISYGSDSYTLFGASGGTIYVPYGCKQAYIDKWTSEGVGQYVLDNIVESDREANMSDVNALKTEIQAELVGKTDYLGTVAAMADLSTIAGAGDYHRVSTEFVYDESTGEVAHVGDILIAVIDLVGLVNTQTKEYWDLVHTELGVTPATQEDINSIFEEA